MTSVESSNATETPVAQTEQVPNEEQTTKAKTFLTEGKDFYLAGTYDQASERLGEALKLGVEVFGENEVDKFETYYYYGKALINKKVSEPTVTTDEKKTEEEAAPSTEQTESKTPYVLAREAFEAAQKIVESQEENKDWALCKAKVLFALGELSVKEEDFTKAITFFIGSLELFKAHSEDSNTDVVEIQVAVAEAYKLTKDLNKAQEFYTKAKETISARAEGTEEEKAKKLKEVEELEKKIAELQLEIQQAAPETEQTDENATEPVNEVTEKIESDTARQGVKRTAEITPTDESKRLKEINTE